MCNDFKDCNDNNLLMKKSLFSLYCILHTFIYSVCIHVHVIKYLLFVPLTSSVHDVLFNGYMYFVRLTSEERT